MGTTTVNAQYIYDSIKLYPLTPKMISMELKDKLVPLYIDAMSDPNVPTYVKNNFRTFLNQNFKTNIQANTYSQRPDQVRAKAGLPSTPGTAEIRRPRWQGGDTGQKKSTPIPSAPLVEYEVGESLASETEKFTVDVNSKDLLVSENLAIVPPVIESELTEKEVEAEIKKLGGEWHPRAGIKNKLNLLAKLRDEAGQPVLPTKSIAEQAEELN